MALLTPDIPYGFPSMNFLMFFYGHGLILFGVFYAVIALNQRPYFNEMNKVIAFTLLLAIPIYFINIILGEPANFWYLAGKPDAEVLWTLCLIHLCILYILFQLHLLHFTWSIFLILLKIGSSNSC